MTILLESLRLQNFKGTKELTVEFNPFITNIYGANNSGKTTIMDAYCWLLFGKDSEGNATTSFNVKTLNEDSSFIPKLEHEVEGVLLIDGTEIVLKKILKQRWEKPNGETEQIYRGDKAEYFINGVIIEE